MSLIEDIAIRSGRPRGARALAREEAILEAALSLVMEVGYDRLSMDALAERAHAGKATIYRHWSGKAEVVVEAIRRRKCDSAVTPLDTGSLRGDLVAAFDCMNATMSADESALLVGVLSAMHKDHELADLMRTQVIDTKKDLMIEIVERAVARGELTPDTDSTVANEVVSAVFFNRLVISGEPIDDPFIAHVVDDIVLPLLRC
jgi:AcrR family transcriptional regulator